MLIGKWRHANARAASLTAYRRAAWPLRTRPCPNPVPNPPRTSSLNLGKGASARPAGNELASNESYQMVNSILEICVVSEHQAEAIQGETGSVGAGSSEISSEKAADIAVSVLESPA